MNTSAPQGYLGSRARITHGPAPIMIEAGYGAEIADAALLHRGMGLADLLHLLTLHEAGVIPDAAASALAAELLRVTTVPAQDFPYDPLYGDAYNSRERELERRLGRTAGWLHTGRTRREAGRIAFRTALRDLLLDLHAAVADFAAVLGAQAAAHATSIWADHTYLQPAQPSTFGHYLGSFGEETCRHLDRLEHAYAGINCSPAGVGGVGGSRLAFDRGRLAHRLGFATAGTHTRDVMWSIDTVTDAALAAVHAAITADRLAEDLEIFTSPGFGYVTLDASLCRASVLMPQKRNPYALAVIRARANTLIGAVTGLLATARTPSARTDNWLDTYGQSASVLDSSRQVVTLAAEAVRTLQIDTDALRTAAGSHFTGAADLAEELVMRCSLDYRSAYQVVGSAVADAVADGRTSLHATDLDRAARTELARPLIVDESLVKEALSPDCIVATRTVEGGSAPERVREHALTVCERAATAGRWRDEQRALLRSAEQSLLDAATVLAAKAPCR